MADPRREQRIDLAAFALGRLDPAEEVALQARLDADPEARAELEELRAVAAALSRADVHHVVDVPEPPRSLVDRITWRIATETLRDRRDLVRRTVRFSAAVVGVAAAVAFVTLAVAQPWTSEPTGEQVELPVGSAGIDGEAELFARSWGTEVELAVDGLAPGARYWLWLSDATGERYAGGSFLGRDGPVRVRMAVGLPRAEATRIWVTDAAEAVVLDGPLA